MTEGNPLKLITAFFIPLFLANVFQQMYNIIDTIIVGKGINDQALAAVGASGSINFLIFGFVIGLANGIAILMAQAFGSKDYEYLCKIVAMSLLLCAVVSIVITAVSLLFSRGLMELMHTPVDIFEDALLYIRIILAGMVVSVMNNLCICLLRSLGDSKTPFVGVLIASATNIILDILFVMVFHMGVAGAAYATVLAQVLCILFCLYRIRKLDALKLKKSHFELDMYLMKRLFGLGMPVAFMNSITAIGCMTLQYFVNLLGTSYAAAYSACSKIVNFVQQPAVNIGFAVSTFAGQNMGAQKIKRIHTGVCQAFIMALLMDVVLGAVLIFFPELLASIMLSDPTIIALTSEYLPISGLMLWTVGGLFIFRSACQGMGYTVVPMLSGFLELFLRVGVAIAVKNALGFTGIAISETSAWAGAFIMLGIYYFYMIFRLMKGENKNQCISEITP